MMTFPRSGAPVLWLVLMACASNKGEAFTPVDDSAPASDDTGPQVWPEQAKVLFYYGSGGRRGGSTGEGGTSAAQQYLEDRYHWHTNSQDELGEVGNYRAVFLMDPGWNGGSFPVEDADKLLAAMELGTRVIVLTSPETCADGLANAVMEGLGVPQRLAGTAVEGERSLTPSVAHQVTEGLTSVVLSAPCTVEAGSATALFGDADGAYAAAWRPGRGGDVVLLGDYNFLDDTGLSASADNLALLANLAEVSPDTP